ncbi:MAG: carboxypeptidase M32 [Firmicutes bacterium]|nr:carboxypeptidase M32 [Bacillota bacterium]
MSVDEKIKEFRVWEKRLSAYQMALSLMEIDQINGSPEEGAEYRGDRSAILYGEFMRLLQDDKMYEIICDLKDSDEVADPDLKREIELHYESLTKERNIPPEEYEAFRKDLDRSTLQWLRAKKEEDFEGYAPYLQKVIDGYKKLTMLQDSPLGLYDRMLDDHQKGWNMKRYDEFFGHVKERVVPLIKDVSGRQPLPVFNGSYPADGQRRVMKKVLQLLGVTDSWCRVTESEHPLTSFVSKGDIRFTTKYRLNDPTQAILSTVHESGHAWFGHNVDAKYDGTIIGASISAGLHESQSRLCENHMGRSKAFWTKVYPWLKEEFPEQFRGLGFDDLYRGLMTVQPSLIRTESDEVTYPIHIMIRYELEKEIFEGGLMAADLLDAWADKYEEYLGLRPDRPSVGVLQDMHWPYAYFGYFPTYALGSAFAAQFYEAMCRDIDPEKLILEDRYTEIMAWLRDHVKKYANRYPADEILKMATGEEFNDEYYLRHLMRKAEG